VHDFNIFSEHFADGTVKKLTFDGTGDIINGTFDWVYEEEFSCRDGFRWNTTGSHLAFWQLDASQIGTFYLINNTDSIYSRVIPVQYPKAGQPPSACRVGIIRTSDGKITWIPVPGDEKENYLPRMQWISDNLLLIQQINRRQNDLKFYTYDINTGELKGIYEEQDPYWVDIGYSDVTIDGWEMEDLIPLNKGQEVLRLAETGEWRHLVKINLYTRQVTNLTPGNYDVARIMLQTDKYVYFNASPATVQRYLYRVSLSGRGDTVRITPAGYAGVNLYQISPNGKYAVHTHSSVHSPRTVEMVNIPTHQTIAVMAANSAYKEKIGSLKMPVPGFFTVTTPEGLTMDGSMTKPPDFDPAKKYPVLFYVYGEPWEQVAIDNWKSNLWETMLAQQGYIVIAMDNRGSPCLKGNAWRKSIGGKIGIMNSHDQALPMKS
jgi:dipeptidyl-peptidase-4